MKIAICNSSLLWFLTSEGNVAWKYSPHPDKQESFGEVPDSVPQHFGQLWLETLLYFALAVTSIGSILIDVSASNYELHQVPKHFKL